MRPTRVLRSIAMFSFLGLVPLVTFCQAQTPQNGPAQRSPQPKSIAGKVSAETVAEGLEHPWALAFLPDGRILVTERPGRLRIVEQGRQALGAAGRRARGAGPGAGRTARRGARSRSSRRTGWSTSPTRSRATAARGPRSRAGGWARARLEDVQVIYRQQPKVEGNGHFGSRLVFADDGTLFVTQGDRQAYREQAQDLELRARQGRPHQPRRLDPEGQSVRREGAARGRRSGRTVTATCRRPRCIRRRGSSGPSSTARAAATS